MSAPFTVLFVCVGNICRSPLGERLLRARLDERLGDHSDVVAVESAGVRAMVGRPMEENAAAELARLGYDHDSFRARRITEAMATKAGLVLAATKAVRSGVLEEAPGALRRTFTITEFAALVDGVEADAPKALVADAAHRRSAARVEEYDVPDPMGQSAAMHRRAADLIDAAVTRIADALATAVRGGCVSGPPAPRP